MQSPFKPIIIGGKQGKLSGVGGDQSFPVTRVRTQKSATTPLPDTRSFQGSDEGPLRGGKPAKKGRKSTAGRASPGEKKNRGVYNG